MVRGMRGQVQLMALSLDPFQIRDCTAEPLSARRLLTKTPHNSLKPCHFIQ